MTDESILAAMRHCRDVLATNGFETDAVTLNNAIRALKRAESTALRPGNVLPGGLVVMSKEPTLGQWEAFIRAAEIPVKSYDFMKDGVYRALIGKFNAGWRAMLAAAQGGSDG